MTPEIAIVVSPRDWAERLHRFVADHGGARVRARILDGREALDEGYQVLVAEDLTSFLTPRLMAELRRSGRRVLGVYDPVEPWGRERLGELGVDDTIESTSSPEQFLRAVDALALTAQADLDAELVALNAAGERGATTTFDTPAGATDEAPSGGRVGVVTVVGGPAGAPGATELCIGLAHAAARRGESAVVVDADEVAPSVAQRLGLPQHPNLRTAIDVVEHHTGSLTDVLVPVPAGRFEVLSGLPTTRDWTELRPGEVVDVIDELARIRHHVIVNVGHRIEELGGAGVASRYGVARALLAEADVLVGVLAPDAGGTGPVRRVGRRRPRPHPRPGPHGRQPLAGVGVQARRGRGRAPPHLRPAEPQPRARRQARARRRVGGHAGHEQRLRAGARHGRRGGPAAARRGRHAVAPGGGRVVTGPANAYETIRLDALHHLERDRIDPTSDLERVREVVAGAVDGYQRRAHLGQGRALADPADMVARVLASITDFGPLSELFARNDVEEIFIEGGRVTFIDTTGRLQGSRTPTTEHENRQLVDRLLATTQRTLDATSPLVQARVMDGKARLTAAQDPISDGLSATIRRHIMKKETLRSLVTRGSLSMPAAGFLWALMQATTSVVTSGPPGSGKTSLLSAMIGSVPSTHCVRCCEEIRELYVPITHGAYYEARPPALDGSSEVSLRDLVKFVLAMRPDLIVVGEVRGAEAFELTRAVNAGTGFACTVHANSARDALNALVNAAIMAGENVREEIVRKVFTSAIDFVVHLDRDDINRADPSRGIRRQVMEIIAIVPALTNDFSTETIFLRPDLGRPLLWTGVMPPDAERIERSLPDGMTLQGILEGRVSPL